MTHDKTCPDLEALGAAGARCTAAARELTAARAHRNRLIREVVPSGRVTAYRAAILTRLTSTMVARIVKGR